MRAARAVAAPSLLLFVFARRPRARRRRRATWLESMNRAVEELNYRGTFVHVLGGTAETLHIVHRNADGQSGERILSLDGAGREIVRQGERVQGILPDRRIVLLETRRDVSPLVSALPSNSGRARAALRDHAAAAAPASRIAPCRCSRSSRATSFATATCCGSTKRLRCRCNRSSSTSEGEVVEQILFTDIEIPPIIPAAALEPTIDTTGFTTLRAPESAPLGRRKFRGARRPFPAGSGSPSRRRARWRARILPSSISSIRTVSRRCRCSSRTAATKADVREGFSTVGSTNAYSLTLRAAARSRRWARCRGRRCARSRRRSSPSNAKGRSISSQSCSAHRHRPRRRGPSA